MIYGENTYTVSLSVCIFGPLEIQSDFLISCVDRLLDMQPSSLASLFAALFVAPVGPLSSLMISLWVSTRFNVLLLEREDVNFTFPDYCRPELMFLSRDVARGLLLFLYLLFRP